MMIELFSTFRLTPIINSSVNLQIHKYYYIAIIPSTILITAQNSQKTTTEHEVESQVIKGVGLIKL